MRLPDGKRQSRPEAEKKGSGLAKRLNGLSACWNVPSRTWGYWPISDSLLLSKVLQILRPATWNMGLQARIAPNNMLLRPKQPRPWKSPSQGFESLMLLPIMRLPIRCLLNRSDFIHRLPFLPVNRYGQK